MILSTWLKSFAQKLRSHRRSPRGRTQSRHRLHKGRHPVTCAEFLEDRCLLAISFVQDIGTGTSTTRTLQIPVNSAVTAGDSVFVAMGMNDDAYTSGSVTDSAGNTYIRDVAYPGDGISGVALFSAHNVKAIPGGGTITVTIFADPFYGFFSSASEFSGLAKTNTLDRVAANSYASFFF